jgi:hypothetical protein
MAKMKIQTALVWYVVHVYNLSTGEAKEERLEFKAILSYIVRSYLKTKHHRKNNS